MTTVFLITNFGATAGLFLIAMLVCRLRTTQLKADEEKAELEPRLRQPKYFVSSSS